MKLRDKVAIVTGSSRGIGKAIAIGYAREGAKVIVMARTEEPGQSRLPGTIHQTAEEIRALDGECLPIRCDLTKDDEVEAMVNTVVERYGRIDVLVNNAAIILHSSVADTSFKLWDLLIKINVRAPVNLCKLVLPHMVKQRNGSIINITSESARDPAGLTLYGAGDAEDAIGELVELVRRDRQWNDEAARLQLVKIFEALGHADPLTVSGRQRLSTILFS